MRRVLLLLVFLPGLFGIGCKSLTNAAIQASQTKFLSQFSLSTTISNLHTPGLDCTKIGPGGGIGSRSGGIGGQVSHSQSVSITCEIASSEPFQERLFMRSLKSEVERQIQSSGGTMQGSGMCSESGLRVE